MRIILSKSYKASISGWPPDLNTQNNFGSPSMKNNGLGGLVEEKKDPFADLGYSKEEREKRAKERAEKRKKRFRKKKRI